MIPTTVAGVVYFRARRAAAVMCSLVSIRMAVAGSFVDRSDWSVLVPLEICTFLRVQHDIFRSEIKKKNIAVTTKCTYCNLQ